MSWAQQAGVGVWVLAMLGVVVCFAVLLRRMYIGEWGFCGGEIDRVRLALPLLVVVSAIGAVVAVLA